MTYSVGVQRNTPTPIPEPPGADARTAPRELTPRSIALGIALALILGSANAYLGLYAGLTVSASIPAAVISMAILRILGGSTILENNVVQTIASAGEAVAAGAIFTFPALVILGGVKTLPYVEVTALCVVGATMGSLLVVFLRRAYIVESGCHFPRGSRARRCFALATRRPMSALSWPAVCSRRLLKRFRTSRESFLARCRARDGSAAPRSPGRSTFRRRCWESATS